MGAELEPGTEVGSYTIEAAIGRGGMGAVYRAQDLRLGRSVALKVLASERAADEAFRERFIRESRMLASLDDPHIVPIFDAGEADGRLYIAMRLVPGPDLRSVLDSQGALDLKRATDIVAQLADALDAAHARGLVHRDVKPANVLLAPGSGHGAQDHVYLSDFGLTKPASSESGLTEIGSFVGTPGYVAPEQIEAKPLDHRVDVYALGCVLYSCLTGQLTYPRDSTIASLWAHLQEPPPRPSVTQAGVPEAFDAVIAKAMARDPAERYQTCGGLAAAARAALRTSPAVAAAGTGTDVAGAAAATAGFGIGASATVLESRIVSGIAPADASQPVPAPPTRIESVIYPIPGSPDPAGAADPDLVDAGSPRAAATQLDMPVATVAATSEPTELAPAPDATALAPVAAATAIGVGATQIDGDAPTAPFALAEPGGGGRRGWRGRVWPRPDSGGAHRRTIAIAAAGMAAVIGTSGLALAFGVGGLGPSPSPSSAGAVVLEETLPPTGPGDSAGPSPSPSLITDGPGVPATPAPTPTPSPTPSPTPTPTPTPTPSPKPDTTRPTGSVRVNSNDKYANSRDVTLSLSAKDNRKVTKVRISNGTNRATAKEYNYSKSRSWTLTKGAGKKSVSVWYYDGRNWSTRYADAIIFDRAPSTPDKYINMTSSIYGSKYCSAYVKFTAGVDFASDPDGNSTLRLVKATNLSGSITYNVNDDGRSITFYFDTTTQVVRQSFIYYVKDTLGRGGSGTVTWDYGPCPP